MKLLVLTALVATCACWPRWGTTSSRPANQYQTTHTKYEPGTVYEYQYESQVMTGLPTFSKQYAGIKIRCDLTLTVGSADWMTLEMKNVRVYSLNNEIQESYNLPPTMQLPFDKFEELPSDHSRLIQGKLLLPLEFEYKDNKVVSMKVADEETNWSIDIKRVVLSMFQVRLQSNTPSVDRLLQYSDLSSQNTTTFDDLEAGLEGSCYSTFHTYVDENDEANTYRVVKFRDQARCVKLNALDKNAFQQRQSNCDCRGNMNNEACQCAPISSIRNSTEFVFSVTRCDYELSSENEKDLVIKSAVMSVEHKMEMPNAPHKFLLTTSNQTLIMTGEKPAPSSRSRSVTMKTVSEPWRMEILKKDEEKLMMTEAELLQQTEKQLQEIEAVASVPERFEDHVPLFLQLQANVRLCTRPQLNTIYSKLQNKPAMRKQLQTFIDALKTANTTEADYMLIEKIGNGELTAGNASFVLIQWAAEKVPTLEMLEEFKKTILPRDYTTAPSRKVVYQHAMLCFGSMVRRFIHNEEILIDQCVYPADKALHQARIEECHKHEKYVEGRLKAAKNDEEKITCLKTFANMGSIDSLAQVIRPYMANTESKIVRIEAINSLIYLGIQDQLQVLQTLMPIMMNRNEETSVRVAAFVVLMKCRSSTPLVELQKCLNEEPDVEFKTFVVQYMKNFLEKQEQQDLRHQMRIRETLKSVRAFRMSYRTSDWQMLYGLNSQGEMTKISRVESTSGRIPEYASVRHYSQWNSQYNHFIEFGYRAEGVEEIFNPSSQHSEQSLLNLLRNSKPSLTFFWKVLGQEVSFTHIDSTTFQAWIRQSMSNNGVLEIPVKMFNTMWMQPRRIRTLLPSGGYLIHEHTPVFVTDVEGIFKVNLESLKRLPHVTFESSKPVRISFMTHQSYYMDMGFSYSGCRSSVIARSYSKSPNSNCTFDWQQSSLACNWTNPADNKFNNYAEWLARTVTFVQPKRLPVTAARFADTCKELKVDESGRREFTIDLPIYKSIEMEGKLEGELNKPELHPVVYKQHLKLSLRPAIPGVKKVCSRYSNIMFNSSDIEYRKQYLTQEHKYRTNKNSFFSYLFNDQDSLSEKRSLYMPSLGAMGHNISCSLATVLDNQVLNMSANWTTYYEPDQPQSKSLWCLERPPIKPVETEYMQLVNKITSTLDSGNGQIMQTHEINWGPKSQPEHRGLTATLKFRPAFKDNVCHNVSVYGCKDDYGVFTPMWYNNSLHIKTRNVEFPPDLGRNLSRYLMQYAQSVIVYPNEGRRSFNSEETFDIDFVVRPTESKIDVIMHEPRYTGNFSGIHAPMFTKLHQCITENRQPNVTLHRSRSSVYSLPSYDHGMRYYDVARRHVCNYAYPSVLTFDQKHLSLPKTSCEVVLARNCQSGKTKFGVTVQPSQGLTAPKILKVNIGSRWIYVESMQNNRFQVKINGTIQPISELVHVPIWDQSRQVGLVECQGSRFELYSYEHGAYVKLYNGILTVEIQENQKDEICGICSPETPLPPKPSNNLALQIAQQYSVKSGCQMIEQPANQYSKDSICRKEQKYRHVSDVDEVDGTLYSCITAESYNVCSDACSYYTRQFITVPARCVADKVARRMNVYPLWQAEELVLDDEQIAQKIYYAGYSRNVRIAVQDRCSQ